MNSDSWNEDVREVNVEFFVLFEVILFSEFLAEYFIPNSYSSTSCGIGTNRVCVACDEDFSVCNYVGEIDCQIYKLTVLFQAKQAAMIKWLLIKANKDLDDYREIFQSLPSAVVNYSYLFQSSTAYRLWANLEFFFSAFSSLFAQINFGVSYVLSLHCR